MVELYVLPQEAWRRKAEALNVAFAVHTFLTLASRLRRDGDGCLRHPVYEFGAEGPSHRQTGGPPLRKKNAVMRFFVHR